MAAFMALLAVANSLRAAIRFRRRSSGRLEQMLHVPPSLRTADPSVSTELAAGTIGLSSGLLQFGNRDMFAVALEDPAKARELFGFAWLAHLDAARTELAEQQIHANLTTWARHMARQSSFANEPAVMARRALSLLAHADAGLAAASPREFDAVLDLIEDELATLAREVKRMPITHARLTAEIALVEYALVSGRSEGEILGAERRLTGELRRQIHSDGGHISRNPAALLEIALDLVPLRRLYVVCQRAVPDGVDMALTRMSSMLQTLRMPDRSLARFNGMGATPIGDLLSVLRHLAPGIRATGTAQARETGYLRLAAGTTVLVFDAGPGQESLPGEAPFAGAMSFEFGSGAVALVVNCGAGRDVPAKSSMRATAAHSTLVLAGMSSAPLVGGRSGLVSAALDTSEDGPQRITARLDGYKARHGEVHHRTLTLSTDGNRLEGQDCLEAATANALTAPYEIHFHLHPSVFVEPAADGQAVRLTAGDGSVWTFGSDELVPAIESSIYYAGASGPKSTLQLVLRGTTADARLINWRFERVQLLTTA